MFTVNQIILHLIGDYLTQSHWMAVHKTKNIGVAFLHALTYSIPFWLITDSITALLMIFISHALIDRYRLARYVVAAKNWIFGWGESCALKNFLTDTGYSKDVPAWLAVWLMIFADNILHIIINGLAIYYF